MLIVFSGLDGAGKSTQIEKLKTKLEKKGMTVVVFWSRGGYTPGMELLKRFFRKSKVGIIPAVQGNSKERDSAFKRKGVRLIWLTLSVFDLIWNYGIVLRMKSLNNKIIICDRYIIDTLIDFNWTYPHEEVSEWFLWKLLNKVALKPNSHFILTITVKESRKRSILKNEPFPDTPKILNYRLAEYLSYVSKNKNTHHIDCQRSIESVESQINHFLQ